MELIDKILGTAIWIFGILLAHHVVYMIIGFFLPAKKYKATDKQHSYCFLIAANNEEAVIANTIDSIKRQDYPADKITIFVCADNCTDKTAEIAREAGAVVYERSEKTRRRSKGYALDYLIKCINRDYERGIETFDGCFTIDADNLMATNYVTEYNKAFADKRFDFFNSYVNSNNCGANWIASYSAIDVMRGNIFFARPKGLLGFSHFARGRGVLYRSYMLVDGWKWCNMAIDANSAAEMISRGYRSSYCGAAELFEEQPLDLKIFFRQRMRWSRGWANGFFHFFPALFMGIFWPHDWRRDKRVKHAKARAVERDGDGNKFSLVAEIQKRWSCYDSMVSLFPTSALTFVYGLLYPVGKLIYAAAMGGGLGTMPRTVLIYYVTLYAYEIASCSITIIREHKRMRANPWQMLAYLFVWPVIAIMLQYVRLWALLTPVRWKKIPHVEQKTIDNIYAERTIAEAIYEKKEYVAYETK